MKKRTKEQKTNRDSHARKKTAKGKMSGPWRTRREEEKENNLEPQHWNQSRKKVPPEARKYAGKLRSDKR